jgi:hypothetical protein
MGRALLPVRAADVSRSDKSHDVEHPRTAPRRASIAREPGLAADRRRRPYGRSSASLITHDDLDLFSTRQRNWRYASGAMPRVPSLTTLVADIDHWSTASWSTAASTAHSTSSWTNR